MDFYIYILKFHYFWAVILYGYSAWKKERSISGFYFKDHIMKDTLINRREFLKNIGVLGAGVLLSASPWLSAFSEVKKLPMKNAVWLLLGRDHGDAF